MKKQRTIYLIVLSVLTAVTIIASICIRIGRSGFVKNLVNGNVLDMIFVDNNTYTSDAKMVDGEIALDAFKSIDIEGAVIDFEIIEGDEYKLYTLLPDNMECRAEVKGDKLYITTSGASFRVKKFNDIDFSVKLEVPKETVLEDVNIEVDAGNVELGDILIDNLEVKLDAGNIEIEGINFQSLNLSANAGNIEVRNCTAKKSKLTADAGNIEIWNSSIESVEASASMGNLEMHKCEFTDGTIEADLGEIDVEAEFESIKAHCSLGEIKIDTMSGIEGKKFDVSADLGTIKIDGREYTKEFRQ